MKPPTSVAALETLGRVRLSKSFFMRDFLYSEVANAHGLPNIPENPALAIEAGRHLCEELLEPLNATFGRIAVRSAYRSPSVNAFGSERGYNCASNEANYAGHIWDRRDASGRLGATACIVVPWFADRYAGGEPWQAMAWWIHDHLPYSSMCFFPKLAAFNLTWSDRPERRISSYIKPLGVLTKPGAPNHEGDHSTAYQGFPPILGAANGQEGERFRRTPPLR